MRLRYTLVLAVAFAAILGYIYFVELQRTPTDEAVAALEFDSAAVTRVDLEHPGRVVILLREEGQWRMSEPVAAAADERNVENLLDAIHESRIARTFEDVDNPATFGLDIPSASVKLHTGEGVVELKVGKRAPVGNSVYIQRAGESAVHLTDASLMTRIDLEATALRDKTVLPFDTEDVERIRLRRKSGDVTLVKQNETWRMIAPAEFDADGASVGGLLNTLKSLRATEFVDDAGEHLGRYGLDAPELTLSLGMKDGGEDDLRMGSERDGKLYVQTNRETTVFAVAAWARDTLNRDANHFRDKSIARFAPDEVATIEIDAADEGSFALHRNDGGWKLEGQPAVDATVEEILRGLSALNGFEIAAEAPADLAAFGLDPPHRSLRVRNRDGEELVSVRIGSYRADAAQTEYTAAVEGSSIVFHIRPFDFEPLATRRSKLIASPADSEGSAAPVPDRETGDGVDENPLDDAAAAGE